MRGPVFFLLGGAAQWEGNLFPCSQCVLIMSSQGSQVLLQDLPNSISDLSHLVCPKFNSHVYKWEKVSIRGVPLFLFCDLWCPKCPKFQKNWWWAQWWIWLSTFLSPFLGCVVLLTFVTFSSYVSFEKEMKMLWVHPWTYIINTSPTMFHSIGKYNCNCLVR